MRPIPKIVFGLLAAITVALLLVACQPNPYPSAEYDEFIDRSLMTRDPCEPPCWYGIEPGDSRDDTLQRLKELPFVDGSTIDDREETVTWRSTIPAEKEGGELTFHQDRLIRIGYQLQYPLTMEELISIYGEPDGTDIFSSRTPSGFATVLYTYWPQQGISSITLSDREQNESAYILADTTIEIITYYEKQETVEEVFQNMYTGSSLESAMGKYYQWNGYGPVD